MQYNDNIPTVFGFPPVIPQLRKGWIKAEDTRAEEYTDLGLARVFFFVLFFHLSFPPSTAPVFTSSSVLSDVVSAFRTQTEQCRFLHPNFHSLEQSDAPQVILGFAKKQDKLRVNNKFQTGEVSRQLNDKCTFSFRWVQAVLSLGFLSQEETAAPSCRLQVAVATNMLWSTVDLLKAEHGSVNSMEITTPTLYKNIFLGLLWLSIAQRNAIVCAANGFPWQNNIIHRSLSSCL